MPNKELSAASIDSVRVGRADDPIEAILDILQPMSAEINAIRHEISDLKTQLQLVQVMSESLRNSMEFRLQAVEHRVEVIQDRERTAFLRALPHFASVVGIISALVAVYLAFKGVKS